MKSKLFISLSTIALVGISLVSHAAYVKYMENDINHVPKGDCLEMMCEHGCVEDQGTFVGHCCPSNGSHNGACNPSGVSVDECCQTDKGLKCSGGKCGCPADKPKWMDGRCCFDVGCGCNIEKVNGCCPGEVNVGCGCNIEKVNGCCPSEVNVGCGCGVLKTAEGCCPGEVNVGCGCGVGLTAEGCCPGVVKGCDGVCGSGKTDCAPRGGGGLTARPCPNCGRH